MRSSRMIRFFVYFLIAVGILYTLDYALYPCTFIRNDMHMITSHSFEDIYMGTSRGKMCIDPEVIKSVTGRRGHNICVGGEYPEDSLYMLRLMIETGHKPKRIIYEVSPGYLVREKEEGNNYLLFFHEFPFSKTKVDYFIQSIAKCNLRTMFFPWYEYPLEYEISHLSETIDTKTAQDYSVDRFKTDTQEYHESGFIARYAIDSSTLRMDDIEVLPVSKIKKQNMKDLEDLIKLCQIEEIEFCAVTTPIPLPNLQKYPQEYNEYWEYLAAFFDSEKVRWINFNDSERFYLFTHEVSAFTDLDGHMNKEAAEAFSRVLANLL